MVYQVLEDFHVVYYPIANVGKPKRIEVKKGDRLFKGISYGYNLDTHIFTKPSGQAGWPVMTVKQAESDIRLTRIK